MEPQSSTLDLLVIGAGAAGHFAAARVLEVRPRTRILIVEKTGKVLSKVRISGGGRCNVTHQCLDPDLLLGHYPRGNPWLKKAFHRFPVSETIAWFLRKGVPLVVEEDGRMFPSTHQSETIVHALENAVQGKGFELKIHAGVRSVTQFKTGYETTLESGQTVQSRQVLVASGGNANGIRFLDSLGLKQVRPVPSLFTFNIPHHPWADLKGVSVPQARVELLHSGLSFTGPILVTHWGFSGPVVLKLSAFGARILEEMNYRFSFRIDWLPGFSSEEVLTRILNFQSENPRKKPDQSPIYDLPRRLWEQLCKETGLSEHFNWAEAGKKKVKILAERLKGTVFHAEGKTTYKEEFVTAGGIDLSEVDPETCQAIRFPGLFFAGEVLDIDGVTGGFNFQAAWSTANLAALALVRNLDSQAAGES